MSAGRLIAAAALLAALPACEAPSPVDGPAADRQGSGEIKIANDYHDRMVRLEPVYQRIAIKRAMLASGYHCGRVDNTAFQQDYSNMKMWVGHCLPEDRSYAVFLAPNGDVQIRNCTDMGTLSLPPCNGLPPPEPDFRPRPGGNTSNVAG